jgi:uncharacterized pyridoxal phosphate-dependent enzyme
MTNRRRFLKSAAIPAIGTMLPATASSAATLKRDFFKELGVRPVINAAGALTALTGSLMLPEAAAAWDSVSRKFVRLDELHNAVGQKIADLVHSEAAMVSSGAAGALVVGTAACITGADPEKIQRIPDLTGMKDQVIIQKSHRYPHDHAVRVCGVTLVEVESVEDLKKSVNSRTAMMLFLNEASSHPESKISAEEFASLGKQFKIPTFNDAAADLPPVENLWKYTKMGFDLVTFSGGKYLRGPQSAGLLLGRKDLIEAARLNTCPNSDSIGRGLKVNKEELIAMLVAVESYRTRDHDADLREGERRVKLIADALRAIPGIKTKVEVPPIAFRVPHLHIDWNQSKISVDEVVKKLRDGDPPIEVWPYSNGDLVVNPWMTEPGEAEIVALRISNILKVALA